MKANAGTVRVIAGAGAGKSVRLHKLVTIIGSAKGVDLQVDGEKVSENHASIEDTGNGVYVLRNRSPFGTLVNKTRIDVHALAEGDRIQIGAAALLEYRSGNSAAAAAGTQRSQLKTLLIAAGLGVYLLGMLFLAMKLSSMSDESAGLTAAQIDTALAETAAMFDPNRKDVGRPSLPQFVDESDPTAAYYGIRNAQLAGESPEQVQRLVDAFLVQLRAGLQEGAALERQERFEAAAQQYRSVLEMLPNNLAPAASLAASRMAVLARKISVDEDE